MKLPSQKMTKMCVYSTSTKTALDKAKILIEKTFKRLHINLSRVQACSLAIYLVTAATQHPILARYQKICP